MAGMKDAMLKTSGDNNPRGLVADIQGRWPMGAAGRRNHLVGPLQAQLDEVFDAQRPRGAPSSRPCGRQPLPQTPPGPKPTYPGPRERGTTSPDS